jgi:dihydroorotate dehydrogenase electron transfer subunit
MAKIGQSEILSNILIGPDLWRMRIRAPEAAKRVRAGQILHIRAGTGGDLILRRPISVCLADPEAGTMDVVFQVKGKGTLAMSRMKAGDLLDYLGPVGNYYEITARHRRIAVVGGGIGIFPLLEVLERYRRMRADGHHVVCDAYLGFRSKDLVVLEKDFAERSDRLVVATDDGSYGYDGLVTVPFKETLEKDRYDHVYACGPGPMIKALAAITDPAGVPCQVSMEQRMGCGVGACLVCVCRIKGPDGVARWKQVCKEGPVFWSRDVVFP